MYLNRRHTALFCSAHVSSKALIHLDAAFGKDHCPGFPGGSEVKASACNAGDLGSILGLGRFLEKEMATHSSILAWRIPWMEKPGGLQSMGSHRVGHD